MHNSFVRSCSQAVVLVSVSISLAAFTSGIALGAAQNAATAPSNWTVVLMEPTATPIPFKGSDGRTNLVYEVIISPAGIDAARIDEFQVLDGDKPERVLLSLQGKDLESHMSPRWAGGRGTSLAGGRFGTVWLNLSFDKPEDVPSHLLHSITFNGLAPSRKVEAQHYTGALVTVDNRTPLVIGPPLRGGKWMTGEGYESSGGHRRALMPVNNKMHLAQRYAIDWVMLDDKLRSCTGKRDEVASYPGYGQPVIAVADGTVVGVVSKFKDQPVGKPSGDFYYLGGNSVSLELGNGLYAFYGHLKPGSIKVHEGGKVTKGQQIAELGNTGNSDLPHLHFHITEGPSPIGSNGVPYVIDSFVVEGRIKDMGAVVKDEQAGKGHELIPAQSKEAHHAELPRELTVVTFP